jgi:hypothetical protein
VSEAQEDVSQKVTQAAGTPEQTQTPEEARTQEVSRKVRLEVRRFARQEIPQDPTCRFSRKDLTRYLPEDRHPPEDPTYR